MTFAEVYDLLRVRYYTQNKKPLFKNTVFNHTIYRAAIISMTITTKRGKQIIFPSCTISNIGTKIPNYLHSRLEYKK